ncbi:hypothetical protein Tco_0140599 [Tanacetum coccineum]
MERDTEVTKDTMHPTNNGSTEDVPPPVVPIVNHESISEPANTPSSILRRADPSPRDTLILGRKVLKNNRSLIDVDTKAKITPRVGREAITINPGQNFEVTHTRADYNHNRQSRIDDIDMLVKNILKEVLGFSKENLSAIPTPYYRSNRTLSIFSNLNSIRGQ